MEMDYVVTYNVQDGFTGFTSFGNYNKNKEAFENDMTIVFQFDMIDHTQATELDWNALRKKASEVWNLYVELNQKLGFYPHWEKNLC